MHAQRNIKLLISLGILIVLSALLVFLGSSPRVVVDKNLFKVEDQTQINKVIIEQQANRIDLSFDGTRWRVNEKYEADRQLITILFATLLQAEPKRLVAEGLSDSISRQMQTHGTRVQLIAGQEVLKDFSVLGNSQKTETYFQADDKVYVIGIPGYRVYVGSVFELTKEEWRDRRVFNFNWQNFKSLSVKFEGEPKSDFKVSYQNQFFGIEGLPAADTTRLNDFLDAVSLLQVNRFLSAQEKNQLDSASMTPEFTIEVTDIANRSYLLEVYPQQIDNFVRLGRVNRESLGRISKNDLDRIARKRSNFTR